MNKIAIIIAGVLLLLGLGAGGWFLLNQKSTQTFRAQLQKADSFEVTFLATEQEENSYTEKMKKVDYQPQVWLLLGTVSEKNIPAVKCGYMGTIQFFEKGQPLFTEPAAFNLNPECRHISFLYNEKIYRQGLLQEGADYLEGLLIELTKENREN